MRPQVRLTLIHVAVFGGATALLLGISYWLLGRNFDRTLPPTAASEALAEVGTQYLLAFAGILLLAGAVGWVLAQRTLEPLEESYEAQRRFIANAGHELRSPLAVIRSEAEVALANPEDDPAELRRAARVVVEASERTEALLDGLLTLARSQSGLLRSEDVDLARAVQTAAASVAATARERGVVVRVEGGSAPAAGDRRLLERLAENLVENAVVHNRRGGHVTVATAASDGEVILRVENTGRPLSSGDIQKLTAPFERLDRTDRTPGAGLGLSIVDSVARAHGGRLALEPLAGGGLRARVRLPGARSRARSRASSRDSRAGSRKSAPA